MTSAFNFIPISIIICIIISKRSQSFAVWKLERAASKIFAFSPLEWIGSVLSALYFVQDKDYAIPKHNCDGSRRHERQRDVTWPKTLSHLSCPQQCPSLLAASAHHCCCQESSKPSLRQWSSRKLFSLMAFPIAWSQMWKNPCAVFFKTKKTTLLMKPCSLADSEPYERNRHLWDPIWICFGPRYC